MTSPERDALNDEYLVVCKGAKLGRDLPGGCPVVGYENVLFVESAAGRWTIAFNLLADDAELGRQVKALVNETAYTVFPIANGIAIRLEVGGYHSGFDLNEAATRACIALKVRVA